MVMHARKLPRFNDGYYEKHQQGHSSYQNSKYSSSKSSSYPDRYNQERSDRSRNSPNGNTSRSSTPEREHSPRSRSFSNKAWYSQQTREKERERDRTYRNEQGRDRNDQGRERNDPARDRSNNKDKYYSSDHNRSPKDRRPVNRDSGYPTNHDRNNSDKPTAVHKGSGQPYSSSKDPLRKSTHGSVRDKRDERERILKVGDWSEHTSSSGKKYYYNCKTEVSQWEKPREWLEKEGLSHMLRPPGSSSRSAQDKHSVSRSNSVVNNYRDHSKYSHTKDRDNVSNWNNRENSSTSAYKDDHYNDHRVQENSTMPSIGEGQSQDMEISSEGSTPTSEHFPSTAPSQQHHSLADVHLPPNSSAGSGSLISLSSSVSKLHQHNTSRSEIKLDTTASFNSSLTNSSSLTTPSLSNPIPSTSENNIMVNQMKVEANASCDTGGPPTPTHSEAQDDLEPKSGASPETTSAPAVSALQGISSLQGFYPMQLPQLTPGLSQYVKDDLTEHVRGWPAEACERQAHKLATEAHLITSMRITDISIALKSARSRVRLNEIQSTLLEQRVMLYRHEVKSLENMKTPSLFTSDDNN